MINQSGEPDVQQHGRINRTLAQQRNTKARRTNTIAFPPQKPKEGLRYMRLKRRPPPV